MRRRMSLAEAHEYARKWSVAPVRHELMSDVYELPFHFVRFGDFGTDYRTREGWWKPLVGLRGDYRLDLVAVPTWARWHWRGFEISPTRLTRDDGRVEHDIRIRHPGANLTMVFSEVENFQLVFEGVRVLAGLDSPEIYLDFLLDSLQGESLRWLETAIQHETNAQANASQRRSQRKGELE